MGMRINQHDPNRTTKRNIIGIEQELNMKPWCENQWHFRHRPGDPAACPDCGNEAACTGESCTDPQCPTTALTS
jgi:hypothetical protein